MEGTGSSVGLTDASGKYELSTFTSSDGAVPGQYKVSIVKVDPASAAKAAASTPPPGQLASGDIDNTTYAPPAAGSVGSGGAPAGPKNLIPAKYATADTSGLRATVSESGPNENNFDLK
jgi:hypothetical protein